MLYHKPGHNNQLLYKKHRLRIKNAPILLYPRSFNFCCCCCCSENKNINKKITWRVTILSSIMTSLAIKSAPTVALYYCVKRALTYLYFGCFCEYNLMFLLWNTNSLMMFCQLFFVCFNYVIKSLVFYPESPRIIILKSYLRLFWFIYFFIFRFSVSYF